MLNDRMVAVERVAAAAEIIIPAIRCEHVIDIIIKSLEGKERAVFITFAGMIEHYVQNNFNTVIMKLLDQTLKFIPLVIIFVAVGIYRIGCKKAGGIVAPAFKQLLTVNFPHVMHLIKLKNRHEFNTVYAKILKIRYLLPYTVKCSRVFNPRRRIYRKIPYMQLVYDKVLHLNAGRCFRAPVKIIMHHPRLEKLGIRELSSPHTLPCHRVRIGIKYILFIIKQKSLFGIIWSVKTIGIFNILNIKIEHKHRKHLAYAVIIGIFKPCKRFVGTMLEKAQGTSRCIDGINGKADTAGHIIGSDPVKKARPYLKAGYRVYRFPPLYNGALLMDHKHTPFPAAMTVYSPTTWFLPFSLAS